ncbi:copper resistance protein B [Sphingomonas sp. DG1-23]|uniref:copper resistance protein B n=1 Tax=Sphingomonas sp. DG1-23 TaxID=3068316 RepID=UPI00273DF5AF|nr:copper resistance protein B [Sphingomonas sp. DG1-23]MDP5278497.1 copper resistance protein B [Sphingomonas sp. DG1-23]
MRLSGLAPLILAMPAAAQDHSAHSMPAPPPQTHVPADPHAGHDMPVPADPHAGHDMSTMQESATAGATGTDLAPGDASAPAPPRDRAADSYWGAGAMATAQDKLRREHGGGRWSQLAFNLAEYQARKGNEGYRWDGEAWIGGDRDRLALKSEGSGDFGGAVESAEVQALYSRALDPYWNLQAGLRQDLGPGPRRTWAAIGVEGVAPWWFDVEGTLFLSTRGDLLGRIQSYYDQRITQDLVLQPRAELNLAAQDVPESATGAGLSDMELGLRLRYERIREFAPYVGVSWERKFGATADYARRRGDETGGTSFVAGIRIWF